MTTATTTNGSRTTPEEVRTALCLLRDIAEAVHKALRKKIQGDKKHDLFYWNLQHNAIGLVDRVYKMFLRDNNVAPELAQVVREISSVKRVNFVEALTWMDEECQSLRQATDEFKSEKLPMAVLQEMWWFCWVLDGAILLGLAVERPPDQMAIPADRVIKDTGDPT